MSISKVNAVNLFAPTNSYPYLDKLASSYTESAEARNFDDIIDFSPEAQHYLKSTNLNNELKIHAESEVKKQAGQLETRQSHYSNIEKQQALETLLNNAIQNNETLKRFNDTYILLASFRNLLGYSAIPSPLLPSNDMAKFNRVRRVQAVD